MTRKLCIAALVLGCSLAAAATISPGAITGIVSDSSGVPQMGAVIEVLSNSSAQSRSVMTDATGAFTLVGLLPGIYTVTVSAPSFLPVIRERLAVRSGAIVRLSIMLNTLFEALQIVPRKKGNTDGDDDWRWALRSPANRPVLRLASDGGEVQGGEKASAGQLKARVSLITSSEGEPAGPTGIDANFQIEQFIAGKGDSAASRWSLNGGFGSGSNAVIRAAYSREMLNGTHPEFALSASHFAALAPDQPGIQSLAFAVSNTTVFGQFLELRYGADTEVIQYQERSTSYHPYCTVSFHPGKNTILQYRYATSAPDLRAAKGYDTAPAELAESNPQLTMTTEGQRIEHEGHHELSFSRRVGDNKFQIALYSDNIRDAALTGTGVPLNPDANILIGDLYSGSFFYNGGSLHTKGVRGVYSHPLASGLDATFDYAYGGALTAPASLVQLSQASTGLLTLYRHSVAAKLSGTVPRCRSKVIASYRWSSGNALTPVDLFNTSAGETDAYMSFFIRQPIFFLHGLPKGTEALLDVRNLFAQGYRSVLADGSTVYLGQGARSIRAGLSFKFF